MYLTLLCRIWCALRRRWAVAIWLVLAAAQQAHADALVVTQAMTATTIAEIFVSDTSASVELEIGAKDLKHFQDLLPDDIYSRLTGTNGPPLEQRLNFFFRNGFALQADDGEPLPGTVKKLLVRSRVIRDEVTGEPLPEQSDGGELVVCAELIYNFAAPRPEKLTIRPPTGSEDSNVSANIGFVAYHNELPVNDFRYLATAATLVLNWDDPWYSRFQNRNLWRQTAAPILTFLYVEPFEVRKEIIVRPKDLQKFVDLGLNHSNSISIAEQPELKERVANFLSEKNPVTIDGQVVTGQLDRIHFVRRSLRRTGIVDPPEELNATSATLGVIFSYPIESLPQEVTMRWELFDDAHPQVPGAATDEAGPMPTTLTPDEPVLHWKNYLRNPTVPIFSRIAPPPQPPRLAVPMVTLTCALALIPLAAAVVSSCKESGTAISARSSLVCLALMLIGLTAFPYARITFARPFAASAQLPDEEVIDILEGLLHNVYRSFDRRDTNVIYDQLSRSIAGDLLEQVYLDTRKSIEVENQGGLQIKVNEVEVEDLEQIDSQRGAHTFRCRWRVAGAVGHWGHIHRRENEVLARITITAADDAWKITAMQLIHEPQPLSSGQ